MSVCPVCGSKEWIIRYRINEWDIDECASCGFARIDPLPGKEARGGYYSEDKVRDRNVKKRSALKNFAKSMKHFFKNISSRDKGKIFISKLYRYLKPGAKVLDVGCGDGTFLEMIKNRFVCTGIEISDYLVAHARKKDRMVILEGDFINNDFKDGKYDGVVMMALIEHLDRPLEALKKCSGLLNDNGMLLLKTVNYGSLNRRIAGTRWAGFRPPDHIVYFNPYNLRVILKKSGFKKINVHATPFSDNMYCEAFK
jgi:SAM-dependent methyltransferase